MLCLQWSDSYADEFVSGAAHLLAAAHLCRNTRGAARASAWATQRGDDFVWFALDAVPALHAVRRRLVEGDRQSALDLERLRLRHGADQTPTGGPRVSHADAVKRLAAVLTEQCTTTPHRSSQTSDLC